MVFYKPEDIAEMLDVKPETVLRWVRIGKLRAGQLAGNKTVRISEDDLMAFYEANATKPKEKVEK